MQVCRNVLLEPHLLLGGGAVEMAVSKRLMERSRALTGVEQWPYRAVAQALEVIPRTLIQNCGASTIRVLTSLRVPASRGLGALLWAQGSARLLRDAGLCVCAGQTHSGQRRVLGRGRRERRSVRHGRPGHLGAAGC